MLNFSLDRLEKVCILWRRLLAGWGGSAHYGQALPPMLEHCLTTICLGLAVYVDVYASFWSTALESLYAADWAV